MFFFLIQQKEKIFFTSFQGFSFFLRKEFPAGSENVHIFSHSHSKKISLVEKKVDKKISRDL